MMLEENIGSPPAKKKKNVMPKTMLLTSYYREERGRERETSKIAGLYTAGQQRWEISRGRVGRFLYDELQ